MVLEHQAHPPPVGGHPHLVAAVQQHPSGVHLLQARDSPQQRRLAAAAGAEHADDLVLGDRQVHRVQGGVPAEPDRRALQAEQHRQNSPVRSPRSRSSTSRAAAHTTIKITERAMAWP